MSSTSVRTARYEGFDHAEREEKEEMFGLQARILGEFATDA